MKKRKIQKYTKKVKYIKIRHRKDIKPVKSFESKIFKQKLNLKNLSKTLTDFQPRI